MHNKDENKNIIRKKIMLSKNFKKDSKEINFLIQMYHQNFYKQIQM